MHGGSGTCTALLAKRPYEGPDQDAEDDMHPDTPPRFSRAQLRSMFQVSLSHPPPPPPMFQVSLSRARARRELRCV